MKRYVAAGFTLSAILFAVATGSSAWGGSMRSGLSKNPVSAPGLSSSALPGQVLWTHYETVPPFSTCPDPLVPGICNSGGNGDAVLRLINSNGFANTGLLSSAEHTVCAMIYVFDTEQEMGECCGCPLSSTKMTAFSVKRDLFSNFIRGGGDDYGNGVIAIVAADQNPGLVSSGLGSSNGQGCTASQSGACNSGCDPTDFPGYPVTTDSNLLGSMTHSQYLESNSGTQFGITESNLYDDGQGDEGNLLYLQEECGDLVGNGSGSGTCYCPTTELSAAVF